MTGMTTDFFATIAVGIGAAACLFAFLHATRRAGLALPKWLLPAGIGLSMIAYTIWNEYSWFDRTRAGLPEGAVVVAQGRESNFWQPWSYLAPVTVRFAALDRAEMTTGDDGIRHAPILLMQRWGKALRVQQDFDCDAGRIRPPGGDWVAAAPGEGAYAAVCEGGG